MGRIINQLNIKMSKLNKNVSEKDSMRGFSFDTFEYGVNRFKCKSCNHVLFASTPSNFVKLADNHKKSCKNN